MACEPDVKVSQSNHYYKVFTCTESLTDAPSGSMGYHGNLHHHRKKHFFSICLKLKVHTMGDCGAPEYYNSDVKQNTFHQNNKNVPVLHNFVDIY